MISTHNVPSISVQWVSHEGTNGLIDLFVRNTDDTDGRSDHTGEYTADELRHLAAWLVSQAASLDAEDDAELDASVPTDS